MIKFRNGAAVAAIAAAMSMASAAHAADNADADATAEILSALTLDLQTGSSLDFGGMVITGAGTVSLAANGTLDCSAATIVCSGTTDVAGFDISTGTANKGVKVNLPTTDVLLTSTAYAAATDLDADKIELNNFVSDATVATDALGNDYYEVVLDGSGEGSFNVGGTINLDGSELPGVYSGTFNVSVEYS